MTRDLLPTDDSLADNPGIRPLLGRLQRSVALLTLLVAYALACFAPFHWTPPASYTLNDARWQTPAVTAVPGSKATAPAPAGRSLVFSGSGLAQLPVGADGQWQIEPQTLHLTLSLQCSIAEQYGPARIATLSVDTLERNLTVAQDGSALSIRLLRPGTNSNGIPDYRVEDFFGSCARTGIDLLLDKGALQLRANGELVLDVPAPGASTERWSRAFPLYLGNEGSWDRGWAGELFDVRLSVAGESLIAGLESAELPRGAWLLSRRAERTHRFTLIPFSNESPIAAQDAVLNVLGFLPFGLLLALGWVHRMGWLSAAVFSALLSGSIELGQIGFEGRFPSATDLVTNVGGGILGFLLGRLWLKNRGAAAVTQTPGEGSDANNSNAN